MFATWVATAACLALIGIVRVLRRTLHDAATDQRRLCRVEGVLTMNDELLVSLTNDASGESRWLHCHTSVPAVVMLARWRDIRMPIDIYDEDRSIVLRPTAARVGLRFRGTEELTEIELMQS